MKLTEIDISREELEKIKAEIRAEARRDWLIKLLKVSVTILFLISVFWILAEIFLFD